MKYDAKKHIEHKSLLKNVCTWYITMKRLLPLYWATTKIAAMLYYVCLNIIEICSNQYEACNLLIWQIAERKFVFYLSWIYY